MADKGTCSKSNAEEGSVERENNILDIMLGMNPNPILFKGLNVISLSSI